MLLMQFIYLSCLWIYIAQFISPGHVALTKGAGSAAALMGALQMGIGAGVVFY